jgi:hypothetical protein
MDSWGEIIEVQVSSEGDVSVVDLVSGPVLSITTDDAGMNFQNVYLISKALASRFDARVISANASINI